MVTRGLLRYVTVFSLLMTSMSTAVPALAATQELSSTKELPFGRLFTTPEERKTLDSARLRGGLTQPRITGVDENVAVTTADVSQNNAQPLKLSGVLLRADGQHQVWVSGGNGQKEAPAFGRKILGDISQSATVKVPLQGGSREAILKPGQVWMPGSGRAEESFRQFVPKPVSPVTPEQPIKPASAPQAPATTPALAAPSAAVQTSSVSTSEVHSSVQSSTK